MFNSNARFWPSHYKNNGRKLKAVPLILKAIICNWFSIINSKLYSNAYFILCKVRFLTLLDVVLFFSCHANKETKEATEGQVYSAMSKT